MGQKYTSVDLSRIYHDTIQRVLTVHVSDRLYDGRDELMRMTDKIQEHFESKQRDFRPLLFARMILYPDL